MPEGWRTGGGNPSCDAPWRALRARDDTFIAGSSRGGLRGVYALLDDNAIFARAAALSPSLWIAPEAAKKMIRESSPVRDTILYMDYGTREMGNRTARRTAFGEMATLLLSKGVLLDCRLVPGGEHCEASWERQIPFFLNTLLYGIAE